MPEDGMLPGTGSKNPRAPETGGDAGAVTVGPEEYFDAGMFLLERAKYKEAAKAFQAAHEAKPSEPRYMSYYGYALAKSGNLVREGLKLCEHAAKKEFYRPELFLNLGRIYVLTGNKRKAHNAFRKGLTIDHGNRQLIKELQDMGLRKRPPIPFLDRKNALNVFLGKILSRLWLR